MKPTTETTAAARGTFLAALSSIDEVLKTTRQPISQQTIEMAVAFNREAWPKWSPGHRYQARWDLESTFDAEINHAQNDWARIVTKHSAGALFGDSMHPGEHASDYYRLPRERAAARCLNALRHASISRRFVSDDIPHPRRPMTDRAVTVLRARIAQRRKDWSTFLRLLAEYRELAR